MAKTNFTKVEGALEEGMRQMMMQHLHELADSISNLKNADIATQKKIIAKLKFEINALSKQDPGFHKKIGLSKSELKNLIELKEFTEEDFQKIKLIKEKIEELKKELTPQNQKSDEELIEKERVKHINKRFNTNDDWLPLH